jgi:hypothetical protein
VDAQKTVGEDAAFEEAPQLSLDESGNDAVPLLCGGKEGLEVA